MKLSLLQELNSEEEYGEIESDNPHVNIALDKAKSRYSHLDSDVEAFVKMMQDEQNEDEVDITALERQVQDMQLQIDELRSMIESMMQGR